MDNKEDTKIQIQETYTKYCKLKINQSIQVNFDATDILGSGSYGVVYAGIINKDKTKRVAVKKLHKTNKYFQRYKLGFQQQIEILKKLNHRYILKFYLSYIDPEKGDIYIITQRCSNKNLEQEIYKNKQNMLSKQRVFKFAYQIIQGMKYVHSQDVIHRDLKPSNILLTDQDDVKVADFGIAKQVQSRFADLQKHTPIGSLIYSSPQIIKKKQFSPKCDVWSVGCIIYEILMKRGLFYANADQKIDDIIEIFSLQKTKRKQLEKIQDPFWNFILDKMLKYNDQQRPSFEKLFQYFTEENKRQFHFGSPQKLTSISKYQNLLSPQKDKSIIQKNKGTIENNSNTEENINEARQIQQLKKIYDRVSTLLIFKLEKIKMTYKYFAILSKTGKTYPVNSCFFNIISLLLLFWNKMEIEEFINEHKGKQSIDFEGKKLTLHQIHSNKRFLKIKKQILERLSQRRQKINGIMEKNKQQIVSEWYNKNYNIPQAQYLINLVCNCQTLIIPAEKVMNFLHNFLTKYGIQKRKLEKIEKKQQKLNVYRLILAMLELCLKNMRFPNNPPYEKDTIINYFEEIDRMNDLKLLENRIFPKSETELKIQLYDRAYQLLRFKIQKIALTFYYSKQFHKLSQSLLPNFFRCLLYLLLIFWNKMQKIELYKEYSKESIIFEGKQLSLKNIEENHKLKSIRDTNLKLIQEEIEKIHKTMKEHINYITSPKYRADLNNLLIKISTLKQIITHYQEFEIKSSEAATIFKICLNEYGIPFEKIQKLPDQQKMSKYCLIAQLKLLIRKQDQFPNQFPYDSNSMDLLFKSIKQMTKYQLVKFIEESN